MTTVASAIFDMRIGTAHHHSTTATIIWTTLGVVLQWRNRLARRTYKQYLCSFLSNAEVVSSSLTWSIRFQVHVLSLIVGAFTPVPIGTPTVNEMQDCPPLISPSQQPM